MQPGQTTRRNPVLTAATKRTGIAAVILVTAALSLRRHRHVLVRAPVRHHHPNGRRQRLLAPRLRSRSRLLPARPQQSRPAAHTRATRGLKPRTRPQPKGPPIKPQNTLQSILLAGILTLAATGLAAMLLGGPKKAPRQGNATP